MSTKKTYRHGGSHAASLGSSFENHHEKFRVFKNLQNLYGEHFIFQGLDLDLDRNNERKSKHQSRGKENFSCFLNHYLVEFCTHHRIQPQREIAQQWV